MHKIYAIYINSKLLTLNAGPRGLSDSNTKKWFKTLLKYSIRFFSLVESSSGIKTKIQVQNPLRIYPDPDPIPIILVGFGPAFFSRVGSGESYSHAVSTLIFSKQGEMLPFTPPLECVEIRAPREPPKIMSLIGTPSTYWPTPYILIS